MNSNFYNFSQPDDFDFLELGEFYIYVQHKPNGDPFYVGKSHVLNANYQRYMSKHKDNRYYRSIVDKYGAKNIKTFVFAVKDEKEAFLWEKQLIYIFRTDGIILANHTDGGDGAKGLKWNEESRKKRIGIDNVTPAGREIIRQSLLGHGYRKPKTEQGRINQRDSRRGISNTEQHNAKISASKIGHEVSEAQTKKQSATISKLLHEKINQTTIETPWGQMGLWDACEKSGLKWKTFKGRYNKGFKIEELFSLKRVSSVRKGRKMGSRKTTAKAA